MSTPEITEITSGLEFPEGPVAMPDGTVIVVELMGACITRVHPDGRKERVATPGGSPNGAAIGPDGALYVCNSGGWGRHEIMGLTIPDTELPSDHSGGRIERVDLDSGDVKVLYTECDGHPFIGPNDIVFDAHGGFWFTDHGRRQGRVQHVGAIYYAQPDGSSIREVVFPSDSPNGIGLSPDGTRLYAAETHTGRVYAWNITAPGEVEQGPAGAMGALLCGLPGMQLFDSLGIDSDGNVVVATLVTGALTVISPGGEVLDQVATGDPMTTNVCWGGADLRTAYVTCSGTGRLVSLPWPRPGLRLPY
ncbi:MAG TPA: SMP-30/gluconolactonase/LRE family protein [Acidimicrobiia bacterium]|nr:SMP-30/gluconolactonase/LRE family protein [Acidimicrobiia bacterium]